MASDVFQVLFLGRGLTGRTTALEKVVEEAGARIPFHKIAGRKSPVSFSWNRSHGGSVDVSAMTWGAPSSRPYPNYESVMSDQYAKRDLDLLKSCHGIVFLLDAQPEMRLVQYDFYRGLEKWFDWASRDAFNVPSVAFLNKCDLADGTETISFFKDKGIIDLGEVVRTIAVKGIGVRKGFDFLIDQLAEE